MISSPVRGIPISASLHVRWPRGTLSWGCRQVSISSFHSAPDSKDIVIISFSNDTLLWCSRWRLIYSMVVFLSFTDFENAKYSFPQPSKPGKSPLCFIHRLLLRFSSPASWATDIVGCMSTKIWMWFSMPPMRSKWHFFTANKFQMYL